MLVSSCDMETSDNGDFDGYWQLASVDTLAT
ncbi:MAG: lipocalin-like domain-containing protein, partial [Prevotella sp.]|nr:lipocalin-like domain-containing protein [Prevotella sp.]